MHEFEDVDVPQALVDLDFLLKLLDVGCTVAECWGDEEVDDFACGDAGVGVVNSSKDSEKVKLPLREEAEWG
jgi:hypothetical protein